MRAKVPVVQEPVHCMPAALPLVSFLGVAVNIVLRPNVTVAVEEKENEAIEAQEKKAKE